MNSLIRIAAFSVAVTSGSANAQTDPIPAPVDQPTAVVGQRIQIEAGTGEGTASVAFALPSPPADIDDLGPSLRRVSADRFSFILATPWNGDDDAELANLGGPSSGTSLTFRWSRFVSFTRRGSEVSDSARGIRRVAEEACREQADSAFIDSRQRLQIPEDTANPEHAAQLRVLQVQRDLAYSHCTRPGAHINLIREHAPERLREYVASLIPRAPYEFGFDARVARRSFDYLDPSSLAELADSRTEWRLRGFYSRYSLRSRTAFTVSAAYERAYEAADEEVFCPPNPGNAAVQCVTGPSGPPELNESALLSLGLRHQFEGRGMFSNLAIAPMATVDALDGAFGAELPVYFLPDADQGLIGGIRFGYRSDRKNEFSVGIFVGAAFDLLGGR